MPFMSLFNKSGDQLAKEAITDYQKSKDEFAVIQKLQKALKIGIKNYPLDQIYLYIGSSYFDLSIYDKANEAYQKGLEYNQKNHSLLSNLGLTYSMMGNPEKSIEYYRASLEIKPDNAYAHSNIGLYNYENGNHFEAIESLDKAISINPKLAVSYSLKAKSLASIGLYKEADLVYREAIKNGFDNGPVLKEELENLKNLNPKVFWNGQKFSELVMTFSPDSKMIENLTKAQKNPRDFYSTNKDLFENKVLNAFEIKNALSWHLLIDELNRKKKILTIDLYSCEPQEILKNIKNLLITNDFELHDALDEFENKFAFSEPEEIIVSIAAKVKISRGIELLNIWTSDHVLNIFPMDQGRWKSLNYPFIDTENGFGKIHPLATNESIEDFLIQG
jgi:tetratricopeptide (TPR) repeat protein